MADEKKDKAPEPKAEAPKSEKTVKGFATTGIKACGERYQFGDALELPESKFEALLEQGLVSFEKPLKEGEILPLPKGAKEARVRALGTVKCGGVFHPAGSEFTVPAEQYEALAKSGFARLVG